MGVQHFYPLGHLYDFSMGVATVDCPVKTSIGAQWCNTQRAQKCNLSVAPHGFLCENPLWILLCVPFGISLVSSLLFLSLCSSSVSIHDVLFCPSFPHTAITLCQITLAEDSGPQVYKGPLGGDWSTWGTCLPIFCDYADCQQVTTVQCTNYFFSLIGTTCSWYSSSLRGL